MKKLLSEDYGSFTFGDIPDKIIEVRRLKQFK